MLALPDSMVNLNSREVPVREVISPSTSYIIKEPSSFSSSAVKTICCPTAVAAVAKFATLSVPKIVKGTSMVPLANGPKFPLLKLPVVMAGLIEVPSVTPVVYIALGLAATVNAFLGALVITVMSGLVNGLAVPLLYSYI